MNPTRTIVAHAVRLASRRKGVTAAEVAKVATCPLRTAQRQLRALADDGILLATVPERAGQRLGHWRNVYRLAKAGRR